MGPHTPIIHQKIIRNKWFVVTWIAKRNKSNDNKGTNQRQLIGRLILLKKKKENLLNIEDLRPL